MKKVFTLVLAMTLVITSFAQVKSVSKKSALTKAEKTYTFTGFEERDYANVPLNPKGMMTTPEQTELAFTAYDWQSNAGPRNYTAVWPDGFAVMCYTLATDQSFSDRGTGLAWFDPAVGEWQFNEGRSESVKTGFGSISRYKENGLVIAAHTATDCRIFIVEDFRNDPTQSFSDGIVLPTATGVDPCWPVVQCSGPNLDIIHVLCTNSGAKITPPDSAGEDPIIYYCYKDGEWTHQYEVLPSLDADHLSDGGSNITYFLDYDPAKPNRVGFIINNAWSDGKAVISEDNGETWNERVFYQHPGINEAYTADALAFMYPRWTDACFDSNDNLHLVYAYNGANEGAGSDGYYPSVGGIGYWSEILPKNDSCVGGIGEVGGPFIMDSTYISQDIYGTSEYWSDQTHSPLPEYVGDLVIVDDDGNVLGWDASEGNFPSSNTLSWQEHGSYNSGKTDFCTMYYDKATDRVFAFWSMIAGNATDMYVCSENNKYYYRLFGNISVNGGRTWEGTFQVITDFMAIYDEMVYGQVIPYVYTDEEGDYLWLCYQNDQIAGAYVMNSDNGEDPDPDDNYYRAVKIHVNYMWDDVEENTVEVPTTMKVYPNPANGTFTMDLNQASDVNIFNVAGQLVKTYKNVKNLNVNLEAGVYFVQAGNQTQKVVVL